jgi:hypothetical protein
MMEDREKIIILWVVFLLGLLFHTQLGLMPLFHGLSVTESQARSIYDIAWVLWLMLGFFTLPMLAIIATVFTDAKAYRVAHFGLTIVYTVLNSMHLIADLSVQPVFWYQIALIAFLLLIGLVLNVVSFQWMQLSLKANKWQNA